MRTRTSRRAALATPCLTAALVCCGSPSVPAGASAEELAQRASELCAMRGAPQGEPLHPFRTDVCSAFLDGSWGDCCVAHDMVYWCGGTRSDRRNADRELRACVASTVGGWRGAWLGRMMEAGTVIGGVPWLPSPWRWGYGHAYPSGYVAPSDD